MCALVTHAHMYRTQINEWKNFGNLRIGGIAKETGIKVVGTDFIACWEILQGWDLTWILL